MDKPQGWTSHDVVSKVRRIAGERSVGHLGTLDPLATGVLPLLLGSATRLARFYADAEKTYEAVIRFGFATDTYDAEGEPVTEAVEVALDRVVVERAIEPFRGVIQQTPPAFSAKKISGVPAYKLARKKKPVDLTPVTVETKGIEILSVEGDRATLRVETSSGFYVRSLAHDLGQALGCGAHLAALRRTRVEDFTIAGSKTISDIESCGVAASLLPASNLLPEFSPVHVDSFTAAQILQGRNFHTSPFRTPHATRFVRAIGDNNSLLAIGEAILPNVYHPVIVFCANTKTQL